eukprot:PhM_4_TR2707/c0_g1_i2/m.1991
MSYGSSDPSLDSLRGHPGGLGAIHYLKIYIENALTKPNIRKYSTLHTKHPGFLRHLGDHPAVVEFLRDCGFVDGTDDEGSEGVLVLPILGDVTATKERAAMLLEKYVELATLYTELGTAEVGVCITDVKPPAGVNNDKWSVRVPALEKSWSGAEVRSGSAAARAVVATHQGVHVMLYDEERMKSFGLSEPIHLNSTRAGAVHVLKFDDHPSSHVTVRVDHIRFGVAPVKPEAEIRATMWKAFTEGLTASME